jgi:Zinc-binding dehydrogenase
LPSPEIKSIDIESGAGRKSGGVFVPIWKEPDICIGITVTVAPIPIGRTFRLEEMAEAHRCMEENRASGKVVVLI